MVFGWSPGIGDPTLLGWLTVVAYFTAAALCYRASRSGVGQSGRPGIWRWSMTVLLALGVNKQLDLQSLLTAAGRYLAREAGWYDDRAWVQLAFVAALAVLGLSVMIAMLWIVDRADKRERLALAGFVALISFVVIRAASAHHVDAMLGMALGGFRLNHALELGGIALIAIPAYLAGSTAKSHARRQRG